METTIKNICDFIREIRNYYQKQISEQRFQAILIGDEDKKIEQQVENFNNVILKLDNLIAQIAEINKAYEFWRSGKESFSFFEDLNADKLEDVYAQVYQLLKEVREINILVELVEIIDNKLEDCKKMDRLEEGNREEFLELYVETMKRYANVVS